MRRRREREWTLRQEPKKCTTDRAWKKKRRQNTDLWRFWWCCPGIIDDSKHVPALIITWAQNLGVGFKRNDGLDERSEKLLQYRIINVLWEPRTPVSEEWQPALTPRSVSLFSIFYGQIKKNIFIYRFHFKVWSFKHDLCVDPWPALYFTNCPQGLCLHEKRSVKIDQSSEDQWEMMIAAQGSKTSRRQPSVLYRLRWCRLAELIFCRW